MTEIVSLGVTLCVGTSSSRQKVILGEVLATGSIQPFMELSAEQATEFAQSLVTAVEKLRREQVVS